MEFFILFAVFVIFFMLWQLYRAKKFSLFKKQIDTELKPKLITFINEKLIRERSALTPNNECHVEASILFWTLSRARIVQAALESEIINEAWLRETGNYRHCQHLFYIERVFLLAADRIQPIKISTETD